MLKIKDLQNAGQAVALLMDLYPAKGFKQAERTFEPLIFGYLSAKFPPMARERRAPVTIKNARGRIDMRHGGNNPVLIELAVRPRQSGPQLYGKSNQRELEKLALVPPSKARGRMLLLVDLAERPIQRENLRKSYEAIRLGIRKAKGHRVRIIYAHPEIAHNFAWTAR